MLEVAPKLNVLDHGHRSESSSRVTGPGTVEKAVRHGAGTAASAGNKGGEGWSQLGDGMAVHPMVLPEEAGSPVTPGPCSGGAEDGTRLRVGGQLEVTPRARQIRALKPAPSRAQRDAETPKIKDAEAAKLERSTHLLQVNQALPPVSLAAPVPEELSDDAIDLLEMATMICEGMAHNTWRTRARCSPRERRVARHVDSFLDNLSMMGCRDDPDGFCTERGMPM